MTDEDITNLRTLRRLILLLSGTETSDRTSKVRFSVFSCGSFHLERKILCSDSCLSCMVLHGHYKTCAFLSSMHFYVWGFFVHLGEVEFALLFGGGAEIGRGRSRVAPLGDAVHNALTCLTFQILATFLSQKGAKLIYISNMLVSRWHSSH